MVIDFIVYGNISRLCCGWWLHSGLCGGLWLYRKHKDASEEYEKQRFAVIQGLNVRIVEKVQETYVIAIDVNSLDNDVLRNHLGDYLYTEVCNAIREDVIVSISGDVENGICYRYNHDPDVAELTNEVYSYLYTDDYRFCKGYEEVKRLAPRVRKLGNGWFRMVYDEVRVYER